MFAKAIELGSKDYYRTHLRLINPVLPVEMTDREIDVLAEFLKVDIEQDRFGTTARALVRKNLNISHSNLSNFMRSLSVKGYLISFLDEKNRKCYKMWDKLVPPKDKSEYIFKLTHAKKP